MAHEPLTPEDATLWCASDPWAQLQIGALCIFDAGPLRGPDGRIRLDGLRAHVQSRLHLSPRFRQRIVPIRFDAARPAWVDDERFDITHHVRAATLPPPGGHTGLADWIDGMLGEPLDPARPLWEIHLVDGMAEDRLALVLRVHHVMADGLALLDAALLLLDPGPESPPSEPTNWEPEPMPRWDRLLAEALVARIRHQFGIAVGALGLLDPRRLLSGVRALGAAASRPSTAPTLPLTHRVGRRRHFVWTPLPMEELVAIKERHGVTLNDVVLAVVTGALRRHLGDNHSHRLGRQPPRALVPVGNFDPATEGNRFAVTVTDLPVAIDDPIERLHLIHDGTAANKATGPSSITQSLFSVVDVIPLPLIRWIAPQVLSRQPFVNLAVTNIPGARSPMYLQGARLHELHPIVTGVGNIALIIGVLSYVDHLGVGITVDPDVITDADALMDDVRAATAELSAATVPR